MYAFMKGLRLIECAKRWLHFLDPSLDYSEWTEQEDEYLVAEVERNGRNWRKIVNEVLPGRSATDVKNRFVFLVSQICVAVCSSR